MATTSSISAIDNRARVGMWVFLASEIMFFGPVFFSYLVGRFLYAQAFAEASRSTDLLLGTANTAVLLTSSATMALALWFAQTAHKVDNEANHKGVIPTARIGRDTRFNNGATQRLARIALDATLLLGLLFLLIKGYEYYQDWNEHLVPGAHFLLEGSKNQRGAELFYFVYFFSILLHGLHLTIGIVLVGVCRWRLCRTLDSALVRRIEITGLYWHFVDLIWIFLFPALYLVSRA